MSQIYGDHNYQTLLGRGPAGDGSPGFLPRKSVYGSDRTLQMGLVPMLDVPDLLIPVADMKAVIQDCNEQEIFAVYHQLRSGVYKPGWYQRSFNFCWAYGLTASTMDTAAVEGKSPVRLAPFSLAEIVGYRNRGYYCDEALAWAREHGIASAEFVPEYSLNPSSWKAGWKDNALLHRPTEWWDTRRASGALEMCRQCLSILRTGRPLYVGYNWWGHALEVCGMEWDESVLYGIVWVLRNSHDEAEPIRLTGEKGIPDEAYGLRATSWSAAA